MCRKVLLLNPPSLRPISRDYYCSHFSKAGYAWQPADLTVLSGILNESCRVKVLDASAAGFKQDYVMRFIKEFAPEVVVCLMGVAAWSSDRQFVKELKKQHNCFLAVSGDYPRAEPERVLKDIPEIDFVINDFTDPGLAGMVAEPQHFPKKFSSSGLNSRKVSYPLPRHELFNLNLYHLPHLHQHPFVTVMTDFGCPFSCGFCSFERIPFRTREPADVDLELRGLRRLGVREVWLRDQSFGSAVAHANEICNVFKAQKPVFSWSCEMRADAVTPGLLLMMKQSGCHTVMLGVESGSDEVLKRHNKKTDTGRIRQAFDTVRRTGLSTVAHFIVGLPGEDLASLDKNVDFCLELDPDYASFNIAVPLPGTSMREDAGLEGWTEGPNADLDSSCSFPGWAAPGLTAQQVWDKYRRAVKSFYLRPSYIRKRIVSDMGNAYRRRYLLRQGFEFLRNPVLKKY